MQEKTLRETQIRNFHEMGEMKRAQELRVNEFSVQKLRESHETIQRLFFTNAGGIESQEGVSQPAAIPSSRSMLSRDKRLPLNTWNMSGPKENVFGDQFSTFDSFRNHCILVQELYRKR